MANSTIRMEVYMMGSGRRIKCRAMVSCSTSRTRSPMMEIGVMISSQALEFFTMKSLWQVTAHSTILISTKSMNIGRVSKVLRELR
jgi:hypothetical protein